MNDAREPTFGVLLSSVEMFLAKAPRPPTLKREDRLDDYLNSRIPPGLPRWAQQLMGQQQYYATAIKMAYRSLIDPLAGTERPMGDKNYALELLRAACAKSTSPKGAWLTYRKAWRQSQIKRGKKEIQIRAKHWINIARKTKGADFIDTLIEAIKADEGLETMWISRILDLEIASAAETDDRSASTERSDALTEDIRKAIFARLEQVLRDHLASRQREGEISVSLGELTPARLAREISAVVYGSSSPASFRNDLHAGSKLVQADSEQVNRLRALSKESSDENSDKVIPDIEGD